MASATADRVLVGEHASRFAFRAGQAVERLLLERGMERARQTGSPIVTAEHVERSLDAQFYEQLVRAINASFHDEPAGRIDERTAA